MKRRRTAHRLGHRCYASVYVSERSGVFVVEFFPNHAGHAVGERDPSFMKLPLSDAAKTFIVGCLQAGNNAKTVHDKLVARIVPNPGVATARCWTERDMAVTIQDIENIKRRCFDGPCVRWGAALGCSTPVSAELTPGRVCTDARTMLRSCGSM